MNTKFIKTKVKDSVPKQTGHYYTWNDFDQTNECYYSKHHGSFIGDEITHWLEEVPDNTDQLMELLEDCKTQLEYLNEKQERGTTNNLLSRLEAVLK